MWNLVEFTVMASTPRTTALVVYNVAEPAIELATK